MKKLLILAGVIIACTIVTKAQTPDKKWNIGLHGGATQFRGDFTNDFYKTDMPFYAFGGLSVSRYIVKHLDVSFLATKGSVGFNSPTGRSSTDITTATINFRFNILGPASPIRPYVMVGGGAILFDRNLDINKENVDYAAPSFGGGINFKLGPAVMLNVQQTFMYSNTDKRDAIIAGSNDAYLFHSAGLSFNFGNKKDADNDGVADRLDKCPNTPPNIKVDKNGCPVDSDKDGVADYMDECPELAGVSNLKGCPDKDMDGVADKDDLCPDVAGIVSLRGCPDSDKDGVADINDKCPGTKDGYKVDSLGCSLDNDKDGVINEEDACPDVAGLAVFKGCPDSDNDGVADNEDRCPTIKGTIANKGCPEITKVDIKRITQIGSKIFFETNSDKLKIASLVQLDELASIMKRYEGAILTIEGYADSQGNDAYNLTLSQKRTEAVKTYLMGKGLMESRLAAVGYGETKPIADNNTAIGRAKNRRVELKTAY